MGECSDENVEECSDKTVGDCYSQTVEERGPGIVENNMRERWVQRARKKESETKSIPFHAEHEVSYIAIRSSVTTPNSKKKGHHHATCN